MVVGGKGKEEKVLYGRNTVSFCLLQSVAVCCSVLYGRNTVSCCLLQGVAGCSAAATRHVAACYYGEEYDSE